MFGFGFCESEEIVVIVVHLIQVELQVVFNRAYDLGDFGAKIDYKQAPAPMLKDARGRAMPPDVNRMVAQMKAPPAKED